MAIGIATMSYAAAAAAFLLLSLLLVTSWRGRLQGGLLAIASAVSAVWASVLAYMQPGEAVLAPLILDILRSSAWFAFLLVLLGYSRKAVKALRIGALGVAALCAAVLVDALYRGAPAMEVDIPGTLERLVLAVIGMVLVEQLFRNVEPKQRWAIKFLCFGAGAMFAFDFYLYSDTLLFRTVNEDIWAARGVVNAFVVPLIAVAAARNPKWSLDVAVSRRIVFHSTAMLGASVYLVATATGGYYIRYVGGRWGAVLQAACLFGAVVLLFVILSSGTLRARLKVFLSKNFFSYRYDYREEWLRFTRALSEGRLDVQLRERSIEAIAALVDSPGGGLWLANRAGDFEQVAHWNMPLTRDVAGPKSTLCQFLQKRQWVVDLERYEAHPDSYEGLDLPPWLRSIPRAWLVVPLILHDELLGFIVLARSKGKVVIDWEVNDILKTAGRQAASYLAQTEAAKALLVARQFESFNRMSAFIVHDLKNVTAQLSLLLANADKHKHKPAFQDDMIDTVSHAVEKITRLLAHLRGTYALDPPAPVALAGLMQQVVAARAGLKPVPRLVLHDGAANVVAHAARLDRVLGHLVQNAIEATSPDGQVIVELASSKGYAVVEVKDTGCGMSEEFMRSRLFRPFETTKPIGMGIGTYEARQYVTELGGRLDVQSTEGEGTTFRVMLPLYTAKVQRHASIALEDQM